MRLRVTVLFALLTLTGQSAAAQSEGPSAGTWAVEGGSFTGASLLRFRSSSSAIVIGAGAYVTQFNSPSFDPATGQITNKSITMVSSQLRLGFRHYGESHDRIRHFSTVAAIVGYDRSGNPGVDALQVGGAADMGAAYFFTPHVSMGGSGELEATYENGGGTGGKRLTVNFPGFRLLGTIYF